MEASKWWRVQIELSDPANPVLHTIEEPYKGHRLCVEVVYHSVIVRLGLHTLTYNGSVVALGPLIGMIELKSESAGKVQLPARFLAQNGEIRNLLSLQEKPSLSLCSDPLTGKALKDLESLSSDYIKVTWRAEVPVAFDPESIRQRPSGVPLHSVALLALKGSYTATRIDLVRKILEPAAATKRILLELPIPKVEEIGDDPEIREAFTLLRQKLELLKDARRELLEAKRATDYRNAIDHARRALEGLKTRENEPIENHTIFRALKKALIIEAVIRSEDPERTEEKLKEALKAFNKIVRGVYSLTSILGIHADGYTPYPQREEAEATVLFAIAYLKYLTETLTRAARKT